MSDEATNDVEGLSDAEWDDIRKSQRTPTRAPSWWPEGVRPISSGGTWLFGLDGHGRLYHDGKLIEIRRRLDLSHSERWFAIVVGAFTILGSIGAVAQGWTAAHQWACQTVLVSKGCPPTGSR